jgi:hypothetical protein
MNNRKNHHFYQDDATAFPEQIDPENMISSGVPNVVGQILGVLSQQQNGNSNNNVATRQSTYLNGADASLSWLSYTNKFQILETSNNAFLPSIEDVPQNTWSLQSSDKPFADKNQVGFRINNKVTPLANSNYDKHTILPIGAPLYRIRMYGYALRVGMSIPCPGLVGVYAEDNSGSPPALMPVARIGENKWLHQLMNTSADMPVYMAAWDTIYAVKGDPTSYNIRFESLSRAEFA